MDWYTRISASRQYNEQNLTIFANTVALINPPNKMSLKHSSNALLKDIVTLAVENMTQVQKHWSKEISMQIKNQVRILLFDSQSPILFESIRYSWITMGKSSLMTRKGNIEFEDTKNSSYRHQLLVWNSIFYRSSIQLSHLRF